MQIELLMERIQLPEEARECARKVDISEEEYIIYRDCLYHDLRDFLGKWKKKPDKLEWALKFYLLLSCETYDKYQKSEFADEVFDQTFYDITIWCEECFRKYGIYGLGMVACSVCRDEIIPARPSAV